MIRGLLESVSKKSAHRTLLQQITLADPLRRFNNNRNFSSSKRYNPIAKALAKQTSLIVEAILSDQAIPDWREAGDCATPQQISDLCILCSHCLVQFTAKNMQVESVELALAWLDDSGLRADIWELISLMYGHFAAGVGTGGLTFEESLVLRDLDDPQDLRYLTRLLDQFMDVAQVPENPRREIKTQKLQKLFAAHQRAFAYTLHTVL